MCSTTKPAETAALAGDPGCARLLAALMDGRALTAGELARVAGIVPQTASGHLARLAAAGVIATHRQGRHDYHRLASPEVASLLGSTTSPSPAPGAARRNVVVTGPRDAAMRAARTCYGHLAGQLGVGLADALVAHGHLEWSAEDGRVTATGLRLLRDFGIDAAGRASGRMVCRPCLDWSERRLHLGGRLGAALAARCFELGWVERRPRGRAVTLTAAGWRGFSERFGFDA